MIKCYLHLLNHVWTWHYHYQMIEWCYMARMMQITYDMMQTTFIHLVVMMWGSDAGRDHVRFRLNWCKHHLEVIMLGIISSLSEPNMITTRWFNVVCIIQPGSRSRWFESPQIRKWKGDWYLAERVSSFQPCLNQTWCSTWCSTWCLTWGTTWC